MTKKTKEKYSYCFPNFLAKAMAKVDFRAQMESGMLSQFFLIVGLSIMMLYLIFTQQSSGWYKFMIIFNLACGWVLISSYLITTYQQYTSYMEAMGYNPEEEKREVKKRGNIFKRIYLAFKRKKNNPLEKETINESHSLSDDLENKEEPVEIKKEDIL